MPATLQDRRARAARTRARHQTELDKFDPNDRPQVPWATFCLGRNPEFKLHRTKGSAKAAITTHSQSGTILYTWDERRTICGVDGCDASLAGLNASSAAPICGKHDAIMVRAPGWVEVARTFHEDTCHCCGALTYSDSGYGGWFNQGTWAWIKGPGGKNTDSLWFLCYDCNYHGPRCPTP